MTTAYLFPGQGSQEPGMGRAFYEAWPETRDLFDRLDGALDVDLAALCFEGSREELRATANTQPAVFAAGLASYAGLVDRLGEPDYVAGHSLGHFTALAAAGALDPVEGVDLVARRGELMGRAGERDGPGRMVAVLLADPEVVADACEAHGDASVAGFNAPRQTVVSGTDAAVTAVTDDIEERTRARFVDLDVGAAFHSPVMRSAADPFAEAVDAAAITTPDVPVCSDVTGTVYTDPERARADLATQITAPVDWVGVVETLDDRGVDRYVELPPAGTLVDLTGKTVRDAETVALDDPADVEDLEVVA